MPKHKHKHKHINIYVCLICRCTRKHNGLLNILHGWGKKESRNDSKIANHRHQWALAQMVSPLLVRVRCRVRLWVQNPLGTFATYQYKTKKKKKIEVWVIVVLVFWGSYTSTSLIFACTIILQSITSNHVKLLTDASRYNWSLGWLLRLHN